MILPRKNKGITDREEGKREFHGQEGAHREGSFEERPTGSEAESQMEILGKSILACAKALRQ